MAAPQHIYESLDKHRFKHFNPGIPTWSKPIVVPENDRVIGFCMPWWEGREENFLPLITPRVIPLAAVAWNRPGEDDFEDYSRRLRIAEATRRKSFYPATIAASPIAVASAGVFHNQTKISLNSEIEGEVRYTLDGSEPVVSSTKYEAPFALANSATVRVAVFVDGKKAGHGSQQKFVRVVPEANLALGKSVTVSVPDGPVFCKERLTDGGTGNLDYFLGYRPDKKPIEITIDLGAKVKMDRVVLHTYRAGESYESYEVEVSTDGSSFRSVAERRKKPDQPASRMVHDFEPIEAQFVRIVTFGHKGQVFGSFSRITEIQVFNSKND